MLKQKNDRPEYGTENKKIARNRGIAGVLAAVVTLGMLPALSGTAYAQSGWFNRHESQNRQKTKNDWRNLAIAAGGVGIIGLLKHDPTLSILGAAGSLYSLDRYEKDRQSQSKADRARAEVFSHPYIYRDGVRYDRRDVTRNGERYYQFVRHDNDYNDSGGWRNRDNNDWRNRDNDDRRNRDNGWRHHGNNGWHGHDR